MLTLLLAVMSGLRQQSQALTRDFGANIAILELRQDGRNTLSQTHLKTLASQFPATQWVGERDYGPLNLPHLGRLTLFAATPGWEKAHGVPVRSGRPLDPVDLDQKSPYAFVSSDLNLSVGDTVRILDTEIRVVGVSGPGGPGRFIQVPASLSSSWGGAWSGDGKALDASDRYHRIRLVHAPGDPVSLLQEVRSLLTETNPLAELHITTPDLLLAETRRISQMLRRVFGSVTLLSLLLGGATLGSLMFQSVRQRRREIGLRLAIGARRRDLFSQFMLEGLLINTLAAALGIFFALCLLRWMPPDLKIPLHVDGYVRWIPFLTACITGGIFSWIPAQSASAMAPAQALRCDD